MKKIELLAPAGNMEKLEVALEYGADAVFLGGKNFNLRAGSTNFSDEELEKAVKYTHKRGKKVYVTLNIIAHNKDLIELPSYVKFLEKIGVDCVLVADLGVFQIVKENSNLPISVSTQASNTNWQSVKMWKELGAQRVVMAREVSLEELVEIRAKVPDIEIEVFIHGAMCMAISGRCLLSNYMTGRDSNNGDCAQPCRWNYKIIRDGDSSEEFPIYEDEHGTHLFNSKDLCSIELIDKILDIGIDSLKIEGRMKGIYYVANAVKIYREAIESYYSGNYRYNPNWLNELKTVSHRQYSYGFLHGKVTENTQNYNERNSYSQTHKLVGKVIGYEEDGWTILEVRNQFNINDEIELVSPTKIPQRIKIDNFFDLKSKTELQTVNTNQIVKIKSDVEMKVMDLLRINLKVKPALAMLRVNKK
ncbi:MAG: U32 family peptidase [Fusobacteriaceae bacterium]|nr:U32 family peptidase [Fusobacteriaceae bacterium]